MRSPGRPFLVRMAIPVTLLISWELGARFGAFPSSLSAPPTAVVATAWNQLLSGVLAKHTLWSLLRLILGVTTGAGLGLSAGMCATVYERVDSFLSPTIRFVAPIPAVVWLPFAIMLFGTGELYKASLPFFITFLLVYVQTLDSARNVSGAFLEVGRLYDKSRLQVVREILAPAALPAVVTGLKIALAISWIALFIVEYSSADPGRGGLGWFIADAREVGRVEDQFAGAFILGVVGYATDAALQGWQRRRLRWAATLAHKPT